MARPPSTAVTRRCSSDAYPSTAVTGGAHRMRTKIDGSAGKITIKHGPIKKFDMEPMTMVFRAADPAMLKAIKPGDHVRFVPERINGQFTITKMEKAK
jgi:Cu/Ag efflux protein CusF